MNKYLILLLAILCIGTIAQAQKTTIKRYKLNESTVVKDSAGTVLPYSAWHNLMMSSDYAVRPVNPDSDTSAFILYKLTDEQKNQRMARMSKVRPPESKFFTTGETITPFNANDINGVKLKLKELIGKTVVLNFWFIGCPPCRQEIPELNKLALSYADDSNVVFIAIALDERSDIKQFIKSSPFAYHLIENGRMYANLYGINLYPTNVVLDKEGKVRFHASGYGPGTPFWIKKTIEEVK
jgi:thiol-disulfide isomerase/thioredoxin